MESLTVLDTSYPDDHEQGRLDLALDVTHPPVGVAIFQVCLSAVIGPTDIGRRTRTAPGMGTVNSNGEGMRRAQPRRLALRVSQLPAERIYRLPASVARTINADQNSEL